MDNSMCGAPRSAGGSPAAGHFPCAAKESSQRKAAPGVAPRVRGVTLCCLTRQGGCGTRPGEAHTTRLTAGLEQVLAESPLSSRAARRATKGGTAFPKTLPHSSRYWRVMRRAMLSQQSSRRAYGFNDKATDTHWRWNSPVRGRSRPDRTFFRLFSSAARKANQPPGCALPKLKLSDSALSAWRTHERWSKQFRF